MHTFSYPIFFLWIHTRSKICYVSSWNGGYYFFHYSSTILLHLPTDIKDTNHKLTYCASRISNYNSIKLYSTQNYKIQLKNFNFITLLQESFRLLFCHWTRLNWLYSVDNSVLFIYPPSLWRISFKNNPEIRRFYIISLGIIFDS